MTIRFEVSSTSTDIYLNANTPADKDHLGCSVIIPLSPNEAEDMSDALLRSVQNGKEGSYITIRSTESSQGVRPCALIDAAWHYIDDGRVTVCGRRLQPWQETEKRASTCSVCLAAKGAHAERKVFSQTMPATPAVQLTRSRPTSFVEGEWHLVNDDGMQAFCGAYTRGVDRSRTPATCPDCLDVQTEIARPRTEAETLDTKAAAGYSAKQASDRALKYSSPRGNPLVLSVVPTIKPILTVELYCKWYELFVVYPDGKIESVAFPDLADVELTPFVDHTPNPKIIRIFAERQGWDFDELAEELITGRWVIEVEKP